jgi:hypothetical protein
MAYDPIREFLGVDPEAIGEDPRANAEPVPAPAVSGFGEALTQGMSAGIEGLGSDIDYFKALFNLATGDEAAAQENIRTAQQGEEAAAAAVAGLQSFGEFTEEPTVTGFIDQVGKFTGQTVSSVATSLAGGGVGGLIGKLVGKKVAQKTAERVARDSIERTARGVATPSEQQLAQLTYDYAKRGALAGAFGAEYVPASAGALREGIEAGQEVDAGAAFRAFMVGAPIAGIGVAAESVIARSLLKQFGDVVNERLAGEATTFGEFAADLARSAGRTAAVEGSTETLQEGLNIVNRASMDDTFTAQDAAMRLGEAAFAGFFSGGALGAAGRAGASAVVAAADSAPIDTAAAVVDKARRLLDSAQSQQLDDQINQEQFGNVMSGNTTPESQADINAQLRAMLDPSSTKNSVWVAGNTPQFRARERKATEIAVDGNLAYAAFIPGRGTIVSTNRQQVEQVVADQASDASLATALGYSAAKNTVSPGDTVVQVFDSQGGVVSEEVTTQDGLAAAFNTASGLMPDGGSIRQTTVEKALEERAQRAGREAGPDIRDMEVDDNGDEFGRQRPFSQLDELLGQVGVQETEPERTVVANRGRKRDPNEVFPNTEEARADYVSVFGDVDWGDPAFGSITEATLKEAARIQRENPNSVVTVEPTEQGYQVVRQDFDELFRMRDGGQELSLPLPEFIRRSIQKAARSNFARNSRVAITDPEGKVRAVNLVDLVRAGQRLVEGRQTGRFEGQNRLESAQAGLFEILGDLAAEGYDVRVDGQSLLDQQNYARLRNSNVTAAFIEGQSIPLNQVLNLTRDTAAPRQQALIAEEQAAALEDPRIRNQLEQAFRRHSSFDALVRRYGFDGGLKEWYARQTDLWSSRPYLNRSAITSSDRYFKNLVSKLRAADPGARFDQEDTALADTGGEMAAMAEQTTGDLPLTPMNIQETPPAPETTAAAPRATVEQQRERLAQRARLKVLDPALNQDFDFAAAYQELLDALKLEVEPQVLSFEALAEMTDAELDILFPDAQIRSAVAQSIQALKFAPTKGGRHIFVKGQKIVIVKDGSQGRRNPVRTMFVLAHELGHSLFKEEQNNALTNPAIRSRLEQAFRKHQTFDALVQKYGFDQGFEEWYADQTARWASRQYLKRQAKNAVDRHFKGLANKLRRFYQQLSRNMRARIGRMDQDFETYLDAVVAAKRDGSQVDADLFTLRAMPQAINEVIVEEGGEALARHWRKKFQDLLKNPKLRPLMKIVRTADGVLRLHAGQKIADMFYVRSQDERGKGRLGMVGAAATKIREMQNKFEDEIGAFDDPEVQEAFRQAATSDATATLTGKAKQIREFLQDFYSDYVGPSNSDIGFQDDYFPVALNLSEIEGRVEEFVDLLMANQPGISRQRANKAVNDLARYSRTIQNEDNAIISFDPTDPAARAEESIVLTRGIPREVMQEAGFLQEPQDAFVNYMRSVVKRVEFNKATKDADGNSILEAELAKLSPEDQAVAREIIGTYLGYQSNPLSPLWRKVNSWAQFVQFVTILPFATIASLPELAGPVIASKEFSAVADGFKQIAATIRNRQEAEQLARDIGVVSSETVSNAWVTQAEQDYMDPTVRKMSDKFFKAIGLEFFTRFSREFAAGMGVQFITKHARNEFDNPRSERYLRELGLTKEDVMAWMDGGRKFSTPEGKKVKQGLQRFVESSILRPNAAERPVWASDPHWAIIWQLKSYFYAYGKVILGGIAREARARKGEEGTQLDKLTGSLSIFALTAVATMPLAMLAMELREYAKYGLAWLLPGVDAQSRYFRTDRMDWPTYAFEVIDRSGFLGPLTMGAMMHQNAEWDKSPLMPLLGPTAETIDTALSNGWRIDRTLRDRLLPIYNQL